MEESVILESRRPSGGKGSLDVVKLATHQDLARKIDDIERRIGKHDAELQEVLKILRKLLEPTPVPPKPPLGIMQLRREAMPS